MGGFKYRGDKRRVDALIERVMQMFPRLRERELQAAGTLSGGEQQMLAFGRALMSEPKLLCMDEPSLGLAPMVVHEIFKSIRAANATGMSVLLVEQNARYALETARRGYVLQTGSIIASGTCDALKQDPRVKEAYLGRR
jgi:branched-chain amino acid transport system ATP-binding protein